VLLGCLLVWSVMTALGGLAASFVVLALTRFGVAFGEAGGMPAGHALIARQVRPERRGLALGLFSMGIPLGTMVGFAAGGAMADTVGWRTALMGAGSYGRRRPGPVRRLIERPSSANPCVCFRHPVSAGCSWRPS
jgi:MFS family permease